MATLEKMTERITGAFLVTTMTMATADALDRDPAKVVLANFVNGVRMALIDPKSARILSDAAEFMVSGSDEVSSDSHFISAMSSAREALDIAANEAAGLRK